MPKKKDKQVIEFAFDMVFDSDLTAGQIVNSLSEIEREIKKMGYKVDYSDWRNVGIIRKGEFLHADN